MISASGPHVICFSTLPALKHSLTAPTQTLLKVEQVNPPERESLRQSRYRPMQLSPTKSRNSGKYVLTFMIKPFVRMTTTTGHTASRSGGHITGNYSKAKHGCAMDTRSGSGERPAATATQPSGSADDKLAYGSCACTMRPHEQRPRMGWGGEKSARHGKKAEWGCNMFNPSR